VEARANTLSVGTEDTGLKALYDRSHLVPIGHNGLLANTAFSRPRAAVVQGIEVYEVRARFVKSYGFCEEKFHGNRSIQPTISARRNLLGELQWLLRSDR
jgi:hypothetical protein